jgi:hypothetical protein
LPGPIPRKFEALFGPRRQKTVDIVTIASKLRIVPILRVAQQN